MKKLFLSLVVCAVSASALASQTRTVKHTTFFNPKCKIFVQDGKELKDITEDVRKTLSDSLSTPSQKTQTEQIIPKDAVMTRECFIEK